MIVWKLRFILNLLEQKREIPDSILFDFMCTTSTGSSIYTRILDLVNLSLCILQDIQTI